ncbi:MauE/DoxX family redox-associated membrane protein [Pedobacter hartonius]|uniref:Methylamine utilisation protein MauE domain-containing protein n=1 Tax=Pedobacter hartonius TaxID=425514 RepID=A0A1H4GLT8_9SPHI|nr:MauE/DoxX family redox-associated membrane protein [Pedobacter hartonius]SEB10583.1 hypothetical protein SAMN05443550_110188 [Pedobacter hartonius]
MIKRITVDIVSYAYVLLFLYAATSKLMDYDNSEMQMSKSPVITDYASILVWLVPALEILISVLIAIPKAAMIGLLMALGMMCAFTGYIFIILNYSDFIPCSCGGVLAMMGWRTHMVFNLVFIFLAIVAIVLKAQKALEKQHSP